MYEMGESTEVAPQNPAYVARTRLELVRDVGVKMGFESCREPAYAAEQIWPLLAREPQEVVGALLLDGRNRFVGYTLPYRGTVSRCSLEARGLYVPALLANASAIIAFHNHPSGDATPSQEDRHITRKLIEAGDILGIRMLDHLVIGARPSYSSLREMGIWDTP